MEKELNQNQGSFVYLNIFYKWKNLILGLVLFITVVAVVISYLIPEKFRATAVVIIPPESAGGLSGLTGLLGGKSSTAALGAKFFGVSSSSEDMLLGILNSRSSLMNVVEKYALMEYYEIDDNNTDKVLRALRKDINFGPNEYGMIEIEMVHENPQTAAEIANYFIVLLDSLNRKFNVEQATNQRVFIEKRYLQNVSDLKNAEDSLYKFQKKYGVFAVPEQLEAAVKASAELESELVKQEILREAAILQYGKNSPQVIMIDSQILLWKQKIRELSSSDQLINPSNVFLPFKQVPDLTLKYYRLFREIEIQSQILEVVLPMYEQAKVEEQKSIPSVMVLDAAVPPQLKDSPKRMFIVGAGFFLTLFFAMVLAVINEYALLQRDKDNALVRKLSAMSLFCKKVFRVS